MKRAFDVPVLLLSILVIATEHAAAPAAYAAAVPGDPVSFAVVAEDGAAIPARWTGPVAAARSRSGAALRVDRTRYGAFAEGALDESAAWQGAETVEIVLEVTTYGVFSAKLLEADGGGMEGWVLQAELEPGTHTLRRGLRAAPDGDLRPATPAGDGVWNPGESGVRRLRLGFSGDGMTVRSIRLEPSGR